MNIENLLKYQSLDEKLYQVEQKLANSQYRKKANELMGVAKKSQNKSAELETEAGKLIEQINEIKEKYDTNKAKADEILSSNIEQMSAEELEKANVLKGKISANLNVLEKMLQKCAENINIILSEFNKAKKLYNDAKVMFEDCKKKIDEEIKELEPEKQKIKKELLTLEKNVEPNLMNEYKKKRADNIFPVVVPLENGTFCGRCRMELPKVAISRIKENGVITCEHCKRFIYQK